MVPPRSRRIHYRSDQEGAVSCASLVLGLARPRRQNCGAVVFGHLLVGRVHEWFVAVRFGDPGTKIAWDGQLGHAPVVGEGVLVRGSPVNQFLARRDLGVDE